MAVYGSYALYDEKGNQITSVADTSVWTLEVLADGVKESGGRKFLYSGATAFLGVSLSPNSSTPDFPIGSTIDVTEVSSYYGVNLYFCVDPSEPPEPPEPPAPPEPSWHLIDSTIENACRTAEADAIRAKTGSTAQLTYDFDNGKGFADAIESIETGITPTGNIELAKQSGNDVTQYASASVRSASVSLNTPTVDANGLITASAAVDTSGWIGSAPSSATKQLSTQAATAITPTESSQTAVESGKYTTGAVTVNPISSTYVGSGITRRSSSSLTASGATVSVPAGYYSTAASKSVSTTTHPKPTASINTSTGVVTASHTQSSGYVTGSTTTGTLSLTTQATKTVTPSASSQTAVAAQRYTTGAVTVAAVPSETKTVDLNMASGNQVVSASSGKWMTSVTVNKPATLLPENIKKDVNIGGVVGTMESGGGTLITKTITQNGTYNASADNADGYSQVTVNVSGGGGVTDLAGTTWVAKQSPDISTYMDVGFYEDMPGCTISAGDIVIQNRTITSCLFQDNTISIETDDYDQGLGFWSGTWETYNLEGSSNVPPTFTFGNDITWGRNELYITFISMIANRIS